MSEQKKHKITNLLISFLLIAVLAAIWFFTQPKQISAVNSPEALTDLPTVSCVLAKNTCTSTKGGQSVTLSVISDDISAFTPLDLQLTLKGITAEQADIDFEGIEMFMGANALSLTKQAEGSFTGTITLPGHTGHGMTWRAVTKLTTQQGSQHVSFEFPLH